MTIGWERVENNLIALISVLAAAAQAFHKALWPCDSDPAPGSPQRAIVLT